MTYYEPRLVDISANHPNFIPFVCAADSGDDVLLTGACVERAYNTALVRGVGHRVTCYYSTGAARFAERARGSVARDGGHNLLSAFPGSSIVLRSPWGKGETWYLFAYRAPPSACRPHPIVELGVFRVSRPTIDDKFDPSLAKGQKVARPHCYLTCRSEAGQLLIDCPQEWLGAPPICESFLAGLHEVAARFGWHPL